MGLFIEGTTEILTGDVHGVTVTSGWQGLQLHFKKDDGTELTVTIETDIDLTIAKELYDELDAIYGFSEE